MGLTSLGNDTNDTSSDPDAPTGQAGLIEAVSIDSKYIDSFNDNQHFDLDFLNGGNDAMKSRSIWTKPSGSMSQQKLHDAVLGESYAASFSSTSLQALCPWFTKASRRREEFKAEMRVLSRLRHPCITTVMGAVVTANRDPVMVMEVRFQWKSQTVHAFEF